METIDPTGTRDARLSGGLIRRRPAARPERTYPFSQEIVGVERLGQEFDGAGLHGAHGHRHVPVARDEDDRHVGPIAGKPLLHVQPVEIGKLDVEH